MSTPIIELLELMQRLRDPASGCPWDREQTFESLLPHTLEEAYEVADVIQRGALDELPNELGDLLFQIVFYAQIASERELFNFDAVAVAIAQKLRARHPHVFGSETIGNAAALTGRWENAKAHERQARAQGARISELDDIPTALPALTRALKLQKRAARVGFDWPSVTPVFDKVTEELAEVRAAVASRAPLSGLQDEVGDLLFATVNLARHLGIDPESAACRTNLKFERRFRFIEDSLAAQDQAPSEASLADLDALWDAAKARGL